MGVTEDLASDPTSGQRSGHRYGRSYYPFDEQPIRVPEDDRLRPDPAYLEWHRESVAA